MSKARYLLFVFVFLFLAGCIQEKDWREDYTERGTTIIHSGTIIENKIFVVLDWEYLPSPGNDLVKVIVSDKSDSRQQLALIESKRFLPKIGQEVEVCFLKYFFDSDGRSVFLPIIKRW